ncbi:MULTISPECIES: AbrB/MazE/SpoVT family DNA-binding domain-containing protein [unclassified Archaeoglobus]|jgi:AbrB family looped-hinge helix DNA binding protein|uniref:AbrB/MazE/SpoVT family DNA-binding domain-containing protein n=1 Tax=unclassified Archaeoglobus TaxID=2643606 RepID=UPI0025C6DE59|nr:MULTISPECIES: AbrB/MazE/SpoVT family DNA-binding domain-containing protein [unclassified Archaeoglobus]
MRVKIDKRGRITIPKAIREKLGINNEVAISVEGDKLVIRKAEDPFENLRKAFSGLSFSREIRKVAESEAIKLVNE